jgi:hypothetical protein
MRGQGLARDPCLQCCDDDLRQGLLIVEGQVKGPHLERDNIKTTKDEGVRLGLRCAH